MEHWIFVLKFIGSIQSLKGKNKNNNHVKKFPTINYTIIKTNNNKLQ